MVSASDSQPQDRGLESRQIQSAHQKPSRMGYGWQQWGLGSLSRKWVPGYRQRWKLYLDYPWRLEACKRVYAPQEVEQVTDITGLPWVIICKALWATFGKKKRYIRTAYYYRIIHNLSPLPASYHTRVVCRQLGWNHGFAVLSAGYGRGRGQIWLSNLQCTGTERNLSDCRHGGWGIHNCEHELDVGVDCFNECE